MTPFQPDLGDEERLERAGFFLDYISVVAKQYPSLNLRPLVEELRRSRGELEGCKRLVGKASHKRAQLRFVLNQVAAEALEILRNAPELLPDVPSPLGRQVRDRFNANYYDFDLPQRLPIDEDDIVEQLGRVDVARYAIPKEHVTETRARLQEAIVGWTREEKERAELVARQQKARQDFDAAYLAAKREIYPALRAKNDPKLLSRVFLDYTPVDDPFAEPKKK
jgi:hypothetical protein